MEETISLWVQRLTVNTSQRPSKQCHNVQFKLDIGAVANVLLVTVFSQVKSVKLEKTKALFCAFGEHHVVPLGTVTLNCTTEKGDSELLLFYVTDSADVPIMSHKACDDLNLVKRVYVYKPMQTPSLTKDRMIN